MGNANYQQQGIWIGTGDPETVDEVTPYAPGMLGKRVTGTDYIFFYRVR